MLVTGLGGAGPGSRIAVINTAQWSGNYLTSGVSSIGIDLKNFGNTDLTVRLLFEDHGRTAGRPSGDHHGRCAAHWQRVDACRLCSKPLELHKF